MADEAKSSVGTTLIEDKLHILRLHAELLPERRGEYPNLLTVRWTYEPDGDNGMPSSETNRAMVRFEELMEGALETSDQGYLTMAIIGNGSRRWDYYTRDEKQTMMLVKKAIGNSREFDVQFSNTSDPHWGQFEKFNTVFAATQQQHFSGEGEDETGMDLQLLTAMAQNGLDLTKAYHTDHFFYVPTKDAAQALAKALQATGMKIQSVAPAPCSLWKRIFGGGEWSCVVETVAVPEKKAVLATSARHRKLAAEHGGRYDGWGVAVGSG